MRNRAIDIHNHTELSNLRILDAISTHEALIKRAKDIGLKGIVFTEHECLSGSIKICKLRKKYPELKLGIGNEIYLTETRDKNQPYYHCILVAKDLQGHRQLRELSSRAWMLSYFDRGLERVPTLYSELEEIVSKNPGHLIATSACIGGCVGSNILSMEKARKLGDKEEEVVSYNNIVNYIKRMTNLFGSDFYLELPPSASPEQILVNKKLYQIANVFNVKLEISCDSHYAKKSDRYVHKSFLNSKGGEREVDAFYQYSYLQDTDEIIENLKTSFGELAEEIYNSCVDVSEEIFNKIEDYDLSHPQTIPTVEVPSYPKEEDNELKKYPNLFKLKQSDNEIKRYWVNECLKGLKDKEKKGLIDSSKEEEYLAELEKEADIKRVVGEKLDTNIFAYPVVLKHYIDMIWECGSSIGAGRGSAGAGLNHWLLGITQDDPLKYNLPFERYMNWDTSGLPDVDFDLCGSKRPLIINKVKAERGMRFNSDIDELSRENLGCTLVATFGTASTKRAIQIACSGYRSEEFPNGIDVDTSQYLSSLIPSERGFVWSLSDTYYGNKEKGREPQTVFVNEVNQYPGLIEIMFGVEGLVVSRGSHASGVILFDKDPYEFGCFMKTPSGDIITQYDLEDAESAGLTKYDWLITSVQDKITETIHLLQKHNRIDPSLTLREVYNKFLSPEVLDYSDQAVWDSINRGGILDLFQFDSQVGSQGIKKVHPDTLNDLSNTNGVIRLMAEDGKEAPLDKFVRYKNNIKLWYSEMKSSGLSEPEMKVMERYMLKSHGVAISQECIMWSLMDKDICGFTLAEANAARKVISKKKMDKLPALKEKVLSQAKSEAIGRYEWEYVIMPSAGYGFSDIHSIFYSMIGFQTAYIATKWNPIYWNTACLIVNSGSLEEDEQIDESAENKKKRSTDYKKLANALGKVISQNINISLIDINYSNFSFEPDEENNRILFGLKALSGINDEIIEKIISNRPYVSIKDFMNRCPLNKTQMISLIKAGAFDNVEATLGKELGCEPRVATMIYYLHKVTDTKSKLNLQNFNSLVEYNLIPDELRNEKLAFAFNKYLKKNKKGIYYLLNPNSKDADFYTETYEGKGLEIINGIPCIEQKIWDKIYKGLMEPAKQWLKDNQAEMLNEFNNLLFMKNWQKYAEGSLSTWEMQSVCFYYHEHELKSVNTREYGIVNFNSLPYDPIIASTFKRGGRQIPLYQINRICGTCIAKDDAKHSISLLTTTGVVNVKFSKDYYARLNKQISEIQSDGTKKVMQKGWTSRGTKLLISGFRREDTFMSKVYKSQGGHQVYLITSVEPDGKLILEHNRYGEGDKENE